MLFERIAPCHELQDLVKEIWVYESDDPTPTIQKIIPDGYSEIIIHYGDHYLINIENAWQRQSRHLFSNQISKYFFLQNSGRSGMIGFKLFPTSFFELFGMSVAEFTDRVVPLEEILKSGHLPKLSADFKKQSLDFKIASLEDWLKEFHPSYQPLVRSVTQKILDRNGMLNLEQTAEEHSISLRQVERLFKKVVGISPKFFSRIIRFNHLFKVIESGDESWVKIALQSGFFDQSHFIKNFKEFAGEEPSRYGFDEKNLANFFLKR